MQHLKNVKKIICQNMTTVNIFIYFLPAFFFLPMPIIWDF